MPEADQGIVKKPHVKGAKWIAVDLDGTLATYDRWRGRDQIGDPIPAMVSRVKAWLAKGDVVCIFTSRVADPTKADHQSVLDRIHAWCEEHIGERLYVTATKHGYFSEIYCDSAHRVQTNTGAILA